MQLAVDKQDHVTRGPRHDWTRAQALELYAAPFNDLLFAAHTVHRRWFDANQVQMSRLLSIKTGGCAEDCGYCAQSAHFKTGVPSTPLLTLEEVRAKASRPEKPRVAHVGEFGR